MLMVNRTRELLLKGELALGMLVRQSRTADTAIIAEEMGFDWIALDSEHNAMTLDIACDMCIAALTTNVTPFVRVNRKEDPLMTRYLDNGALGVIVPHVDTAEDARFIVERCKFAPVGNRSIARQNPIIGFENLSMKEYAEHINRETMVVAMLESPLSIENCEEIAAVEGVDALFIGAGDLSWEYGVPGQSDHELIVKAYEKVIAACNKHKKFAGMAGIREQELVERFMTMGARYIMVDNDLRMLMAIGKTRTKGVRDLKGAKAA